MHRRPPPGAGRRAPEQVTRPPPPGVGGGGGGRVMGAGQWCESAGSGLPRGVPCRLGGERGLSSYPAEGVRFRWAGDAVPRELLDLIVGWRAAPEAPPNGGTS